MTREFAKNLSDRTQEAVDDSRIWFPDQLHRQNHMFDLSFWLLCLGGETGELQNKAKKWLRGTYTSWEEVQPILADELVDVFVYAFNVAATLGIDLEEEYNKKRDFNDRRWNPNRAGADGGTTSFDSRSGRALREDVPTTARDGRTEVWPPHIPEQSHDRHGTGGAS